MARAEFADNRAAHAIAKTGSNGRNIVLPCDSIVTFLFLFDVVFIFVILFFVVVVCLTNIEMKTDCKLRFNEGELSASDICYL